MTTSSAPGTAGASPAPLTSAPAEHITNVPPTTVPLVPRLPDFPLRTSASETAAAAELYESYAARAAARGWEGVTVRVLPASALATPEDQSDTTPVEEQQQRQPVQARYRVLEADSLYAPFQGEPIVPVHHSDATQLANHADSDSLAASNDVAVDNTAARSGRANSTSAMLAPGSASVTAASPPHNPQPSHPKGIAHSVSMGPTLHAAPSAATSARKAKPPVHQSPGPAPGLGPKQVRPDMTVVTPFNGGSLQAPLASIRTLDFVHSDDEGDDDMEDALAGSSAASDCLSLHSN